jgi:hypothetical protein
MERGPGQLIWVTRVPRIVRNHGLQGPSDAVVKSILILCINEASYSVECAHTTMLPSFRAWCSLTLQPMGVCFGDITAVVKLLVDRHVADVQA